MDVFRIQIAATFTAEPVQKSLDFLLGLLQVPADVSFSPFNQVFQELLDPGSSFAQNRQGANVLLLRWEDLSGGAENSGKLAAHGQELITALRAARERFRVPVLLAFCPPSAAALADAGLLKQFAGMEAQFVSELRALSGLPLISSEELGALCPVGEYDFPLGHALGAVPYTPRFYHLLGRRLARTVFRLATPPHKVIVLDCDQTLWKGVVGEEGPLGIEFDPPRRFLQEFMRDQCAAGMVLCLCSKNNEPDVWEVFDRRPEMPLRREHIVAWRINWERKSENIKSLARELQLGLDSFIFVDDDPVVCADVQSGCPEVLTIRLPEDVSRIPEYFRQHWAFDHLVVTAEDSQRTEMYRANAGRSRLLESAGSLEDFLQGLDLKCDIAPMLPEQLSRVAQLTQRTNQFNFNPVRRNEAELQQLLHEGAGCLVVQVRDRFGDYGLVGAIIHRVGPAGLEVDSFLMSCRALGRGVEHRMMAALGQIALEAEQEFVALTFTPTKKNRPAQDFLEATGAAFQQATADGSMFRYPARVALEMTPAASVKPVSAPEAAAESVPAPAAETRSIGPSRAAGLHQIAGELHPPDQLIARLDPPVTVRPGLDGACQPPANEMETALVEIWQRILKVNPVGVTDDYFALGGDSLRAVSLFVEIEEKFGRHLPLATLFTSPTIRTLAACLTGGATSREWRNLVPIQVAGSRPPLFCFHAAGGNVLFYRDLSRHLADDQPVYGLQAREMPDTGTYLDTVEAMATEYLKELTEFQPRGPYFLCGSSFGGLLAYEAAQQLRARQQDVALVALFDTYGPGYPQPLPSRRAGKFYALMGRVKNLRGQLARLDSRAKWQFLQARARKVVIQLRRRWLWKKNEFQQQYSQALGRELPKDLQRNHKAIQHALHSYVPKPCIGRLTLFRAARQPQAIVADPFLGWKNLVPGGIEVIESSGEHGGMTVDPYAKDLAGPLGKCLSAAGDQRSQNANSRPANSEALMASERLVTS